MNTENQRTKKNAYLGGSFSGSLGFLGSNMIADESGYPLLTMTCKIGRKSISLFGEGVDRPDVMPYLTRLLKKFRLGFNIGVLERGLDDVGFRFEFPTKKSVRKKLQKMWSYVESNPDEFQIQNLGDFDCLYNLSIRMPKNGEGLLVETMDYLSELGINPRYMRAERDPGGESKGYCVRVFAQLEAPKVDRQSVEAEIQKRCPPRSKAYLWDARQPAPVPDDSTTDTPVHYSGV